MKSRCLFLAILIIGLGSPAMGLPIVLDYTGFSWSHLDQGIPVTFNAVGVVDGFTIAVNDPDEVYTFWISGLELSEIADLAPSVRRLRYESGELGLYRSTGPLDRGYAYGTHPANDTAPSTFSDGVSWLNGTIETLTVTMNTQLQIGTLEATGQYLGGEFAPMLEGDAWFSFAGLTGRSGNGIPAGYGYRMDGQATATVCPIPEPGSLLLMGTGLCATALLIARRRRA